MRRVLSLWQPWASLCVVRDPVYLSPQRPSKQWETRHWKPKFGPPFDVAIHATKRVERAVLAEWPFNEVIARCGISLLPAGAIIGVATVAEFAFTENLARLWSKYEDGAAEGFAEEIALGDYRSGRWGWRLENAIALPDPIPFKGRQDVLYQLDPTIEKQIDEQLAGVTI